VTDLLAGSTVEVSWYTGYAHTVRSSAQYDRVSKWSNNLDERPHRRALVTPRRMTRCPLRTSLQPRAAAAFAAHAVSAFQQRVDPKIVPSLGDPGPQLTRGSHPSPQPKRHLDQFSRFCRAHGCDRRTDRRTDRQTDTQADRETDRQTERQTALDL